AQVIKTKEGEVRRLALQALTRAGADAKPALPEVIALLKQKDRTVRIQALQALESIGPEKQHADDLRELLKGSDKEVSMTAIRALVKIGQGKSTIPYLISWLKSGPVDQRKLAAQTLAVMGSDAKPAVKELLNALEDETLRGDALGALVKVGKGA